MKITIAIPLGTGSKWEDNNELRYMLRSLNENLSIDYEVKLFAREVPPWIDTSQVRYEIVKRYYPEKARKHFGKPHFENFYDVLNKLYLMAHDESVSEKFVLMYDDILLIKPINLYEELDIKVAETHYLTNKKAYDRQGLKWTQTVMKAWEYCKDRARPRFSYETHLPRVFDKTLLRRVFELYPIEDQTVPYAPSTLYFNLFYNVPDIRLDKENNIKAGFYATRRDDPWAFSARTKEKIDSAVKNKTWVNYNNMGLRHGCLSDWIKERFPNPSKFEVY